MAHEYGGLWTEQKLQVLKKYLGAYTTALKNTPFSLMYVDAFAGTGDWSPKSDSNIERLFNLEDRKPSKGSARLALEIQRPFDRYVFIEKKRKHFAVLKSLAQDYPDLADRMEFRRADANEAIEDLCKHTNWRGTRAVLFLDPYGMQVDWATIEAVARTAAIDMWYWVPTGMGIARVAARDRKLPAAWEQRLDRMLGTDDWRMRLYRVESQTSLFGEVDAVPNRAPLSDIEQYFLERLRSVFVAAEPTKLSLEWDRSAMYMLVLAVSNKNAKALAYRLAQIEV